MANNNGGGPSWKRLDPNRIPIAFRRSLKPPLISSGVVLLFLGGVWGYSMWKYRSYRPQRKLDREPVRLYWHLMLPVIQHNTDARVIAELENDQRIARETGTEFKPHQYH